MKKLKLLKVFKNDKFQLFMFFIFVPVLVIVFMFVFMCLFVFLCLFLCVDTRSFNFAGGGFVSMLQCSTSKSLVHITPEQSKGVILLLHCSLLLTSHRGIATHEICSTELDFCSKKCENLNNNCTVIDQHRTN